MEAIKQPEIIASVDISKEFNLRIFYWVSHNKFKRTSLAINRVFVLHDGFQIPTLTHSNIFFLN